MMCSETKPGGKELNYLEWLSAHTPTKWWHDSAIPDEIERGLAMGALGITTNPVLTYKTFNACPDYWRRRVEAVPEELDFAARAEEMLRIVATDAAQRVYGVFERTGGAHGYAFGQLNPTLATDVEGMVAMGRRVRDWAPNVAVKLPTTKAGVEVIEELAACGVPLCATLNFSVAQALAVAQAYERGAARAAAAGIEVRPCFAVQQLGRFDDYLRDVNRDLRAGLSEADVAKAGLAITKRSYQLIRERGYRAVIMPAGLREVYHLTELAGAEMTFSLHPRIQQMVLDADPPRVERIGEPIDPRVIDRLLQVEEFRRAYLEDGLAPEEFFTFGVTQKTLSQFVETGWAMLEVYGSQKASARWT